jgi:two-component system sensor histidine kinase BaeS
LLDNGLKYTPVGGQANTIGRQATTDCLEIRVADSRPEISPEQLAHAFECFYQANEMRTGVGLGLAIAREIVLVHGGNIEVSSTLGGGAEFIVKLPTSSITSPGQGI